MRPEKLRLTRARPEGVANAFPVWVEDVAYMGNLSVYRLKLASGKYIHATRANLARYEEDASPGTRTSGPRGDDTAGVVLTQ